MWDDTIFLRDLPLYRTPGMGLAALFQPFILSPNYFRPLALLTFEVELRLFGLNPAIFHATNLLLHAINTSLVCGLVWRLYSNKSNGRLLLALTAGSLYGLHPALLEGVAFISSRFDLLVTAFLLLALYLDLVLQGRWQRPLFVGLAFLLAALCKEMAVALILVMPAWHLSRWASASPSNSDTLHSAVQTKHSWSAWEALSQQSRVYLALFVAGMAYLLIRYGCLGYLLTPATGKTLLVGNAWQHALLFTKSLVVYILLMIWPFGTLAPIHYSILPVPASDFSAWVALVVAILVIAGLVWLVRRQPSSGWLASAALLALLPVSNLIPLELGGGAFIAERFLLFPMALACLAVVTMLSQAWQKSLQTKSAIISVYQFIFWLVCGLWLIASLATIQLTLPFWESDLTLWSWAARHAPQSAMPPTNLSLEYTNRNQYQAGQELAQKAIQLDENNADAWNNLGLALFMLGKYSESQAAFEKATQLLPQNALYWSNLAGTLREQNQLGEAERLLLDQALPLDPNLPATNLNLGIVYLKADRPDLAAVYLQAALRLLPPGSIAEAQKFLEQTSEPARWLRLGDLLLQNNEFQAARRAFQQAASLGAAEADVAVGLSAVYIGEADYQNASQILQQALQAAPDDARLYNNLGILTRQQGDLETARQYFSKAVELAPDWQLPQQNLDQLGTPKPTPIQATPTP